MSDKSTVELKFSNAKAAEEFLQWLCNSGEQTYWDSMEYVEEDDKTSNITGVSFNYDFENHNAVVECGRMDEDEEHTPFSEIVDDDLLQVLNGLSERMKKYEEDGISTTSQLVIDTRKMLDEVKSK